MNPEHRQSQQPSVKAPAHESELRPHDPTPRELGKRIKLLRITLGLTLKEVEERGGISATHVSEIERGKASPTIGALGRIATALGLRPATLLAPRRFPAVSASVPGADYRPRIQWGSATLESVNEGIENATIGAHTMSLPAGGEAALSHRHEGEEWVLALQGTAQIRVGDTDYVLRPGDALHFRAHLVHSYTNLASTPARLLIASRPRLVL